MTPTGPILRIGQRIIAKVKECVHELMQNSPPPRSNVIGLIYLDTKPSIRERIRNKSAADVRWQWHENDIKAKKPREPSRGRQGSPV